MSHQAKLKPSRNRNTAKSHQKTRHCLKGFSPEFGWPFVAFARPARPEGKSWSQPQSGFPNKKPAQKPPFLSYHPIFNQILATTHMQNPNYSFKCRQPHANLLSTLSLPFTNKTINLSSTSCQPLHQPLCQPPKFQYFINQLVNFYLSKSISPITYNPVLRVTGSLPLNPNSNRKPHSSLFTSNYSLIFAPCSG